MKSEISAPFQADGGSYVSRALSVSNLGKARDISQFQGEPQLPDPELWSASRQPFQGNGSNPNT